MHAVSCTLGYTTAIYTIYTCRVLSRVLLIPFELPSCGPVTAEECTVYGDFQRACESGKYSSLVRWIIKQGKTMLESGEERIQEIRENLQGNESHSMVSRNVLSWAISFYFLEKVYMYICCTCTCKNFSNVLSACMALFNLLRVC